MAESFLAEVDAANHNQQDEEVKQQEEVQKPQKQLYSWGWNEHGNLGLGDKVDRHEPTLVPLDSSIAQ